LQGAVTARGKRPRGVTGDHRGGGGGDCNIGISGGKGFGKMGANVGEKSETGDKKLKRRTPERQYRIQ